MKDFRVLRISMWSSRNWLIGFEEGVRSAAISFLISVKNACLKYLLDTAQKE
jgi:hypothetical protein